MNELPDRTGWRVWAALAGRWLLGGLFLYLGVQKAGAPEEFLKLVREYHLMQTPWLLNTVAAVLPWFEVFCGVLMLTGVAVRGTALLLVAMLVPFTAAIAARALDMQALLGVPFCAVKFDCGCGTGEVLVCRKLVENAGLTLLAAWLAFTRTPLRWALWPRARAGAHERISA